MVVVGLVGGSVGVEARELQFNMLIRMTAIFTDVYSDVYHYSLS